uniref:Uncharacterized protein n=1 Tax=Magallana gigas TaxID=29159 RepID=K1Q6Y0_MAGGI
MKRTLHANIVVQRFSEGVSPNIKPSRIPSEIIATLAKRQEHPSSEQYSEVANSRSLL